MKRGMRGLKKNVQREKQLIQLSDPDKLIRDNPELQIFDFKTLAIATNQFSEANELGKGGFGTVYKGTLSGQEIAVKKLSVSSRQGMAEFLNEVLVISNLQHRNPVKLFGYCIHLEEKILVFEYVPNNSLDSFLFNPDTIKLLDWKKRFEIIKGICNGVVYLHRGSRIKVIHRDLKAANILLDENLKPKIADFGLARIFKDDEFTAITNKIAGTRGYISPEYYPEGCFSEKSDVFSFGVLLLEIVSGKKHFSGGNQELPDFNLLNYAWRVWNEKKQEAIIDQIMLLHEPSIEEKVLRCVNVGLLCVEESADDRPTIAKTLLMLTGDIATFLPAPQNPAYIEKSRLSPIFDESESHFDSHG